MFFRDPTEVKQRKYNQNPWTPLFDSLYQREWRRSDRESVRGISPQINSDNATEPSCDELPQGSEETHPSQLSLSEPPLLFYQCTWQWPKAGDRSHFRVTLRQTTKTYHPSGRIEETMGTTERGYLFYRGGQTAPTLDSGGSGWYFGVRIHQTARKHPGVRVTAAEK